MTSAALLPNAEQQFCDPNGQPYANGTVYFYQPGTTTQATVWKDPLGATPWSQPVQLDSAGRAIIYGNQQYSQVLFDQFGTQIWNQLTQDPLSLANSLISPAMAPVVAAATTQAAVNLLSFSETTKTSFTRLLSGKLLDVLSVKDFGALGNNVADDTLAIQEADIAAYQLGVSLYFPPGKYRLTPTGVTMHGASWYGASQYQSLLVALPQTYAADGYMVYANGLAGFTIKNLGFDFSQAALPSGNLYTVLAFVLCNNWMLSECQVLGIVAEVLGVAVNGGEYFEISDCYFNNPTPSGTQNQAINVSDASGMPTGFKVSRNIMIGTGCDTSGSFSQWQDNYCSGTGFGGGLVFNQASGCLGHVISGNVLVNGTGIDTNATRPSGIECWASYTLIENNFCGNNAGPGITIGNTGTVVKGNICLNNGQYNPSSGIRSGGIIANSVIGGSGVEYTAQDCVIVGNYCCDSQGTPTQSYGYYEVQQTGANPLNNNTLADNVFIGNALGTCYVVGTETSWSGPKLFASITLNPGTVAANGQSPFPVNLAYAEIGDMVRLSFSQPLQNMTLSGFVSSVGTIVVLFVNGTSSAITPGSGTLRIILEKMPNYVDWT